MTEEEAIAICKLYGFDPEKAGKTFIKYAIDYPELVRATLAAEVNEMKACMTTVGNLVKFATFLGNAAFGNDPSERATCLIGVNKILQTQWVEIEEKPYGKLELNDAVTEMLDTSKLWAPSIQAFGKELQGKGLLAMLKGRESLGKAGAAKTEVYELIQYFHDKKISFDKLALSATNDRGQRIKNINRYRLAAPALTPFAGIPAWGPGDAEDNSPKTNLRNHMFKHVLDDDQKEKEPLEWTEEPEHWWKLLGIELTLGDAKQNLPGISKQIPPLFGQSATDEAVLPIGNVRAFLDKARPNMTAQFEDFMCNRYLQAYSDFALKSVQNFSRAMIGCEKKHGHTVGIYIGALPNIFLFGRLEDAGNNLGLSSCYLTKDLDAKFNSAEELWPLSGK